MANKHLDEALENGKITLEQHGEMMRGAGLHPLVRELAHMNDVSAMKIYGVASPEEKAMMRPHLRRKIAASTNMTIQRKYETLGKLK
jgi:hypothetical protein